MFKLSSLADNKGKQLYLESLRGLAALVVFFTHMCQHYLPYISIGENYLPWLVQHVGMDPTFEPTFFWSEWFINTPLHLLVSGQFAVSVFFILSGYVLTYKFLGDDRPDSKWIILGALAKRPLRLLPVCLVSVIAFIVVLKMGWMTLYEHREAQNLLKPGQQPMDLWPWANDSFTPWYLIKHSFTNWINGNLWTIRLELIGSIYCFLFVLFFGNFKYRWFVYPIFYFWLMFSYLEFFVIGIVLADIVKHKVIDLEKAPAWSKWSVLLIGLYMSSFPTITDPAGLMDTVFLPLTYLPTFTDIQFSMASPYGAILVFIAVLMSRTLKRKLSWKPFVFLGNISYSMYVIHILVIYSIGCGTFLALTDTSDFVRYPITILVTVLVTLVASVIITMIADKPSMKMANWLGRLVSTNLKRVYNLVLSLKTAK